MTLIEIVDVNTGGLMEVQFKDNNNTKLLWKYKLSVILFLKTLIIKFIIY